MIAKPLGTPLACERRRIMFLECVYVCIYIYLARPRENKNLNIKKTNKILYTVGFFFNNSSLH